MSKKNRKCWWDSLAERQRQSRIKNGTEERKQRNVGMKQYLASFNVGDIKEYDGPYDWDYLRCAASRMNVFGTHYVFNTHLGKRYIIRIT